MIQRHILVLAAVVLAIGQAANAQGEPVTVGPNGEPATPVGELELSDDEVAQIRDGGHTAAFAWHELYDWSAAVARGAKDEFDRLGIEVVAETNAGFDAARQKADVETIMALQPSILISLPVDPELGEATYAAARDAGTAIVFIDNTASGFVHGEDYVTTVSADLVGIGRKTSEAMNEALNGEGQIGYIFHDAAFPVTNQRDQAFKWFIENDYPGIEIVAEGGMADPARIEDIANAMLLQNPDIDALYVPWAEPATGVLAVLRQLGREEVKIITIDLNEPAALNMVTEGQVAALIADEAYAIGTNAARAAAAGLLGRGVPPFLVVDAVIVRPENLAEGWRASLNQDPPEAVQGAMQ